MAYSQSSLTSEHELLLEAPFEDAEQDANELPGPLTISRLEYPRPFAHNVTVSCSDNLSGSISTFSGPGELMGRLARYTGGTVLSFIDNTVIFLRLRSYRWNIDGQQRGVFSISAPEMGRMMFDLQDIAESSKSGLHRQCVDLIKRILLIFEVTIISYIEDVLDFFLGVHEHIKDMQGVEKTFIKFLRQYCKITPSIDFNNRERVYSVTAFLHKLALTTNQFCDTEILTDILFILSSPIFLIYTGDETFREDLDVFVEHLLEVVGDWLFNFIEDHRCCYLYASLAHIHSNPISVHRNKGNSSLCVLGLYGVTQCGTVSFKYPSSEAVGSFAIFEAFHGLRNTLYGDHRFFTKSMSSLQTLLASPNSKKILLSNGLKDELLAFLPSAEGGRWRFGEIADLRASSAAIQLLDEIGERYWDRVIEHHLEAYDEYASPYLETDTTSFGPLAPSTSTKLVATEVHMQQNGRDPTMKAALTCLAKEGYLTVLPPYFRDLLIEMKDSRNFRKVRRQDSRVATSCMQIMKRNLKSNILQLDDVLMQYNSRSNGVYLTIQIQRHIGDALRSACQNWLSHVVKTSVDKMGVDDIRIVVEVLEQFFIDEQHFLRWIEVMSVTKQVIQAEGSLLSLCNWLKGNEDIIGQKLSDLISECYDFVRLFHQQIASGPLQVYISALPFVSPGSHLCDLYGEHAKYHCQTAFIKT